MQGQIYMNMVENVCDENIKVVLIYIVSIFLVKIKEWYETICYCERDGYLNSPKFTNKVITGDQANAN